MVCAVLPMRSLVVCRPGPLIHTRPGVHNARQSIVRYEHLIGCGFREGEAVAAIGALRGADHDHAARTHIAGNQAVELAPLPADGESGPSGDEWAEGGIWWRRLLEWKSLLPERL